MGSLSWIIQPRIILGVQTINVGNLPSRSCVIGGRWAVEVLFLAFAGCFRHLRRCVLLGRWLAVEIVQCNISLKSYLIFRPCPEFHDDQNRQQHWCIAADEIFSSIIVGWRLHNDAQADM
jgi:hypothetical protein